MVHQLVLLLPGKVLHPLPQQKIVLHSVEFDTRADILFELALEIAGDLPIKKAKPIISSGDGSCLLKH
jgi:hypothetical protein